MKIGDVTITSIDTSGKTPLVDNRTKWTERQIRGSEKKAVVGLWVGAVFPLIFGAFALWFMKFPFFMAKNVPNPFFAFLLLISVFGIVRAIWETVRLNRFGDPVLELGTAPIPLGGTVEGRITLRNVTDKAPEFTTALACIHRVHRSTNSNSGPAEYVLWSTEQKASMLLGGILPISIAVPADQPPTNGADPFDCILWRLTVTAPFGGQKFLERYEVPVRSASVAAK